MSEMNEEFKDILHLIPDKWGEKSYSDHNNGNYIWIVRPHNKSINKKINANDNTKYYTIIHFGFYEDELPENNSYIPVKLSINFGWYDSKHESYPMTMPKGVRIINCPINFENQFFCYWDSINKKILDIKKKRC